MTNVRRNSLDTSQNIAVVGVREEVLPFIAMGATVFITRDPDAARKAVLDFSEKGHPVILVSDDLIRDMGDILDRFSSSPIPAITSIPGKPGVTSFTDERMTNMIKQAIGLNLSVLEKQ